MIVRSDVCGVVVTYHPGDGIAAALRAVSDQVGHLVIVDNGSAPKSVAELGSLAETGGWMLMPLGRNMGIAAALNLGLDVARSQGCRWLATFDQDSEPTPSMLDHFEAALRDHPQPDRVAIVAPTHVDRKIGLAVRQFASCEPAGTEWRELVTTMTSGNLVDVDKAIDAGGWRESLFIDYVDHEFCLRLRRSGWKIIEATSATLIHSLGKLEIKKLGPLSIAHTNHEPIRRYYMTRNRYILWRDYWGTERKWVVEDMRTFFVDVVATVLFENQVIAKGGMILRGLIDGTRRVSGPFARRS